MGFFLAPLEDQMSVTPGAEVPHLTAQRPRRPDSCQREPDTGSSAPMKACDDMIRSAPSLPSGGVQPDSGCVWETDLPLKSRIVLLTTLVKFQQPSLLIKLPLERKVQTLR